MLSKADAEVVRSQNRRIVIDHLRHWPVSTRRRVSEETGLSLSSASAIASDLTRAGIVDASEGLERPGRRGRPEMCLELAGRAASVAALKVSVGEIAVSIADYAGKILATLGREVDLSALSEERFLFALVTLLEEAAARLPASAGPLRQIVVSVQGVTDRSDRRILWSPILKPGAIDLATPLEAATGAPTRVLNDCSVMPERFRWNGEGPGDDFATVFMGFGVGMGLRLGGRTFRGVRSSALEFGHLNHVPHGDLCRCGNHGCIEAYAGDYAIWRAAKGMAPHLFDRRVPAENMRLLADAAREGETAALLAFERAGEAVGYGLGRIFTLIDPLPVVFIGTGAEVMDLLEEGIRRGIRQSSIAGAGEDVAFTVMPDVDAVTIEAATTLALAALDEEFSKAPNAAATEAA